MLALAIAIAFASFVGALAYALPKFYWYRTQSVLIIRQADDEKVRFDALKESHDLEVGGKSVVTIGSKELDPTGQYL